MGERGYELVSTIENFEKKLVNTLTQMREAFSVLSQRNVNIWYINYIALGTYVK